MNETVTFEVPGVSGKVYTVEAKINIVQGEEWVATCTLIVHDQDGNLHPMPDLPFADPDTKLRDIVAPSGQTIPEFIKDTLLEFARGVIETYDELDYHKQYEKMVKKQLGLE